MAATKRKGRSLSAVSAPVVVSKGKPLLKAKERTKRRVKETAEIDTALSDLKNTLTFAMNEEGSLDFQSYKRQLEIHPSSFPYCPLREMHNLLNHSFSPLAETTFSSNYFVNVGTLVHTLIQRYMGKSGKVWGLWKCRNRNCNHEDNELSLYHDCPKCGSEMYYEEIGYSLKKTLSGHQDCLFQDSSGNFWVVDYKTCLLSKAIQHSMDGETLAGNNTYKAQQTAYVALCQRKFKKFFAERDIPFQVKGYILVYMPRDIPFQFQFVYEEVSDEIKEQTWKTILKNIEQHNTILDATSFKDIEHLIKEKPCSSFKQYKEEVANAYHECPLASICFNARQLKQTLYDDIEDSTKLPLRKTIMLAIEEQKEMKGALKC